MEGTLLYWIIVTVLQGPIVSIIVDWFKRLEYVQNHPKLVAAVLNLLVTVALTMFGPLPKDVKDIVVLWYSSLMASIGFHELKDAVLRTLLNNG